jgi:predicted transcriptional regulator
MKPMRVTLSIRIDSATKMRLDALAKRSRRSQSHLVSEAIQAYVESEECQLGEIEAAIAEAESGQTVDHETVANWLQSWGKPRETRQPR